MLRKRSKQKGQDMLLKKILSWDGKILLFIQDYLRFPWLTKIMKFITKLGDGGVVWIVLAAALLCKKRQKKTGTAMAVALVIGYLITNLVLKNLVMRTRPYEVVEGLESVIGAAHDSSFPSGHTTSSIAAGFVMLTGKNKYIGVMAFALAILISFSRMYLGVHYPTDVLAGVAVGLFAAFSAKHIVKA